MSSNRFRVPLSVVAVLLFAPAIVWLIIEESFAVNAVAALGLGLFISVALLGRAYGRAFWSWALGILALVAPPALMALGASVSSGTAADGFEAWIFVYVAGAGGGLVLEILKGRGRLELPGPAAAEEPQTTAAVGAEPDPFAPYGDRVDIGLFARLTMGGIAAFAILILIKFLVDEVDVNDLAAAGRQLDTIGWAVLIGAASPAVWAAAQGLVEGRVASLTGAVDALGSAADEAQAAVQAAKDAAEPTQTGVVVVDQADLLAADDTMNLLQPQLSREELREKISAALSRHAAAAVPDVSAKLAEAAGALRAVQAGLGRVARRSR